MEKYKFVKWQYKEQDIEGKWQKKVSPWMFTPQSEAQVFEFFDKFTIDQKNKMQKRMTDIVKAIPENVKKNLGDEKTVYGFSHPTYHWEEAHFLVNRLLNHDKSELTLDDNLRSYDIMTAKMLETRLTLFRKGIASYYDRDAMVSRCFLSDEKIVKEIECDELEFPQETDLDNVRFIKWVGGEHWYAKMGDIDIVVDGEQKWNTREAAEKAAEKYIQSI